MRLRLFVFSVLCAACSAPAPGVDGGAGGGLASGGGGSGGGLPSGGGSAFDAGPAPVSHLDTTFGDNGCTLIPFGVAELEELTAVAVAADNSVWVAGQVTAPDAGTRAERDAIGVAHLSANGQLDPRFGGAGFVRFELARGYHRVWALRPHGAGVVVVANSNNPVTLVKLDGTGTWDRAFGDGGVVVTNAARTTAGGNPVAFDGDEFVVAQNEVFSRVMLQRYTASGARGPSVTTDVRRLTPQAIVLEPSGTALVAGPMEGVVSAIRVSQTDGGLDATLGAAGVLALHAQSSTLQSLVRLTDGSFRGLVRLNALTAFVGLGANGQPDARLSADGGATPTSLPITGPLVEAKPNVLGAPLRFDDLSSDPELGANDMALALVNPDGGLDTTAPNGGYLVAHRPNSEVRTEAAAVAPGGVIYLAGYEFSPTTRRSMAAVCRVRVP
jgi:hypothetical protein